MACGQAAGAAFGPALTQPIKLQVGRFNPARVFVLLLSGPAICWLSLSGPRFREAMGLTGWENRTAHRRSHRL
jgi:hypothetical protein